MEIKQIKRATAPASKAGKTGSSAARGGARPGAGRKPLPTAVKRVKGTLQPCRANPNEPQPLHALGEPAAYMSEGAKAAWHHAVQCAPPGLLTALDAMVVERWANAADLYRQLLDKVAQAGFGVMLVKGPNGVPRRSPLMDIIRDLSNEMRGYEADMGFTPAARSRVSITPAASQQADDPWAAIVG